MKFTWLILLIITQTSRSEIVPNAEHNLTHQLFNAFYSHDIRPVKNWNDTLVVTISLSIIKVADVIEDSQNMILHVKLQFSWIDYNLKWNPKDYDGLDSMVIPSAMVWLPDIHLFNSASEEHDLLQPLNVELYSNGTIITTPISHLNAHCDFDFSRFPFDTQKCTFNIGSTINESKLKLKLNAYVNEKKLFTNPEWKYVSYEVGAEELDMSPLTDVNLGWSSVLFTIKVKRESAFFVNLFIWPLIFILFLITCIFILPPSCVERVTLGTLLLLSLIMMLLMLDLYTPKNSVSGWPVVGKLIMLNMFMATISTLVSSLIIGMSRDAFMVKKVPPMAKNFLLVLAKLTFKAETAKAILFPDKLQRNEEIQLLDINQINQSQQQQESGSPQRQDELSKAQMILVLINNQLALLRMRIQEKDLKNDAKREWDLVALMLDRLCLIFYFILIFFGLISVFD